MEASRREMTFVEQNASDSKRVQPPPQQSAIGLAGVRVIVYSTVAAEF
jgi:hypothetical protein